MMQLSSASPLLTAVASYCGGCTQDWGCKATYYAMGYPAVLGQPWSYPYMCMDGIYDPNTMPFPSLMANEALGAAGTNETLTIAVIAENCCGTSATTCLNAPICHEYQNEWGYMCPSATPYMCTGGLFDSPIGNPYLAGMMGMACAMGTNTSSCVNFTLGDEMRQYCCGEMGAGGVNCNANEYHGCQQSFFKAGGMCDMDCDYGMDPVTTCPFEDAAFCDSLANLMCDPENPSEQCQEAVATYCCMDGPCTQDYGCKQVYFEAGGACPMDSPCAAVGIYACPFNDPYICGQFNKMVPGATCADTYVAASGLPVFSDSCQTTLEDYCCGETNMTCPQYDLACKTTFFLSGATCKSYGYSNCHNGIYNYGPCNGFSLSAPFCNTQACIDNPYSLVCATGSILPYCCGGSKDSCSLDPQCRALVFPMFNAPGTAQADLKTTMVTYGPAGFQNSASYPCRWQCTWANVTHAPTKPPSHTMAPTTKSPTAPPKKSSASGVSTFVSVVALVIACLL